MKKQTDHKKMGRPSSPYPMFLKKFRATEEEQAEFLEMLPGDAREDFEQVVGALRRVAQLESAIKKHFQVTAIPVSMIRPTEQALMDLIKYSEESFYSVPTIQSGDKTWKV